jgi:gliding motility-associated-like protein
MYTDLLSVNNEFKNIISLLKPKAMLLAFGFWLLAFGLKAQVNYVQNPSFENTINFDPSFSLDYIWVAPPWDSLKAGAWGLYTTALVARSPSVNFGGGSFYQEARTGSLMSVSNQFYGTDDSRRYIQQPLYKTLKPGQSYCVTSYFNLTNRSQFAADELSIYFDDGSIKTTGPGKIAPANPQIKSPKGIFYTDTLNWMKVQGSFIAKGTESYITIGNFSPPATLTPSLFYPNASCPCADYFLDDVSVIEADLPAYAGRDTVLCIGDSVFIGRPPEIGLECLWFNSGSQIANGGGLWVKPITTQTYTVNQDVCGIIKTAKIQVQVKPKYTGSPNLVSNITTACLTDTVKLNIVNTPDGNKIHYEWLPKTILNTTTNITAKTFIKQTTLFTSNITSKGEDGYCPFTRTNTVEIILPDSCFKDPQIPNIFTPNNDEVNDVWQIKFPYGYSLQALNIYNRWGTLIYATNNLSFNKQNLTLIGWDGRATSGEECAAGVYFYVMKYTDKNNTNKTVKGHLTLMK